MIPQPPSISAPENVAAFTPYQSAQPLKSSCFDHAPPKFSDSTPFAPRKADAATE